MSRIYVAGFNGFIGSSVLAYLSSCGNDMKSIGRTGADFPMNLFDSSAPQATYVGEGDVIVFAAAVSSPDLCFRDYDSCWRANVEGTSRYISAFLNRGARVLFLSSDAVFASEPDVIYDEDSEMSPRFPYGKMKAAIESAFEEDEAFKALRLSYVFSSADKFTNYLERCRESRRMADVYHPYYRNCISMSDVCTAISWLIKNWVNYPHRKLNLAGRELVSRVRMADELSLLCRGAQLSHCFSGV